MKKVLKIIIIILNIIFVMGCQNILDKDLNNEKNSLAIMVEDENNSDKYTKYNNTNWPSSEEYYFYKADCQNNSEVNWNPDSNSIILKGNREDSCTLFFNKNKSFVLISDYELENRDAQLTNMIKNGSFEEGNIETWGSSYHAEILNNNNETQGNKYLVYRANDNSFGTDGIIERRSFKELYANHSYYGRLKYKTCSDYKWRDARYELIYNSIPFTFFYKSVATEKWILGSNILKLNYDSDVPATQVNFRDFAGGNSCDVYVDELMIIDLTAGYGDNIPTKEFLDNNLVYFEGTIDFKTEKGNVGTFKLKTNDGNITSENIECTNNGVATVQDKVITITSNNERTTCYLHKN